MKTLYTLLSLLLSTLAFGQGPGPSVTGAVSIAAAVVTTPGVKYETYSLYTNADNACTGTSMSYTINLGSSAAYRGIVVFVAGDTTMTVTVGGLTATLIGSQTNRGYGSSMYGLATSTLYGQQTVQVTASSSVACISAALSATGVNQTTPFNNSFLSTCWGCNPLAYTVTSNSGDLTFSISNSQGSAATSSQTAIWSYGAYAADIGGGTGNTTHSWSGQDMNSIIGANFVQK